VQATAEQVAFDDAQLAELLRVARKGIGDLLSLQKEALERAQ
jgi:ribonuclease PH